MAEVVNPYLIATEDAPMEKILGDLLRQNHQTIGTAESCTGGYIAHLISSIPGASSYFKGSIVSYDNEIKSCLLGVPPSTIAQEGAVCEAVVKAMAEGLLTTMKTDYAIAVSGIMGPEGGSEEKPVGTVWIAVGNSQEIRTQKLRFRFNRHKNIQLTAMNALLQMRNMIAERN
jgi:nicotinamide-nucleotide amidase